MKITRIALCRRPQRRRRVLVFVRACCLRVRTLLSTTVAAEHGLAWESIYATLLERKTARIEALVAGGQLSRAEAEAHLAALRVYQMTPLLTTWALAQNQERRADHQAALNPYALLGDAP